MMKKQLQSLGAFVIVLIASMTAFGQDSKIQLQVPQGSDEDASRTPASSPAKKEPSANSEDLDTRLKTLERQLELIKGLLLEADAKVAKKDEVEKLIDQKLERLKPAPTPDPMPEVDPEETVVRPSKLKVDTATKSPTDSDLMKRMAAVEAKLSDLTVSIDKLAATMGKIPTLPLPGPGTTQERIGERVGRAIVENTTGSDQSLLINGEEWSIPPGEHRINVKLIGSTNTARFQVLPYDNPKVRQFTVVDGTPQVRFTIFMGPPR